MKRSFLFVLFLIVPISLIFSCSCVHSEIKDSYKHSDLIFYGKCLSNKFSADFFQANGKPLPIDNFEIIKIYKGFPNHLVDYVKKIDKKDKFIITLESTREDIFGGCGINFETGKYYLVYAYKRHNKGTYETSICTRTRQIHNNSFKIEYLFDSNFNRSEDLILDDLIKMDALNRGLSPPPKDYDLKLREYQNELEVLRIGNLNLKIWNISLIFSSTILLALLIWRFVRK